MKLYSLTLVAFFATVAALFAQVDKAALAAESEAKSVATATDPISPEIIKAKVEEAAALIAKEGPAAFPKFYGKDSPFIFSGTYLVVRSGEGMQLVHPIKYKSEGNNMLTETDKKGNPFYAIEHDIVKTKGQGWMEYWWPKPGEKVASHKAAFTKGVTFDGQTYIVTGGLYDLTEEQIAALVSGN